MRIASEGYGIYQSDLLCLSIFIKEKRWSWRDTFDSIAKLCIIVGIMVIPQTICQSLSGVELPLPALITKVLSFVALGGFALYFNRKMYHELGE